MVLPHLAPKSLVLSKMLNSAYHSPAERVAIETVRQFAWLEVGSVKAALSRPA
jgi:hypothetical protein